MRLVFILLVALSLGLVAGCETFVTDGEDAVQTPDLEEYGGYTLADEAPNFGDADLVSSYPDEEPYDDEVANDPRVQNAITRNGAKHYTLRMIWGNLGRRDSTLGVGEECPVTDWSGSLTVNGGVVIVKRLVRFDRGDYIVRPRPGPSEVEWVSHTQPHLDGIVFHIVELPRPSATDTETAVTITTPLYSATIPIEELDDYREFVVYDDCNKISVVATETAPAGCPRGFLEGAWTAETDSSGRFKGIWIGDGGRIIGHLRGEYRVRDGRRVLFGKWVNRSGNFKGLLKGTWSPLGGETGPDGYFEGRWVDRDLVVKGVFKGHYCLCGDGQGFFHGRWIEACR
jgi:hypothetical protein